MLPESLLQQINWSQPYFRLSPHPTNLRKHKNGCKSTDFTAIKLKFDIAAVDFNMYIF